MLYIVIDHYLMSAPERIQADSNREAVERAARLLGIDKCLSKHMVMSAETGCGCKWQDEVSYCGWGEGCKFEGKPPAHQVIFWLVNVSRMAAALCGVALPAEEK